MSGEIDQMDVWKEWGDTPLKLDLGEVVSQVQEIRDGLNKFHRTNSFNGDWTDRDVIKALQDNFEGTKFELSAEVIVAQGNSELILLSQQSQVYTLRLIYQTESEDMEDKERKFYCTLRVDRDQSDEHSEPAKVMTRIMFTSRLDTKSSDSIIVSNALSQALGISDGDRIVIEEIHEDIKSVDLDKFI